MESDSTDFHSQPCRPESRPAGRLKLTARQRGVYAVGSVEWAFLPRISENRRSTSKECLKRGVWYWVVVALVAIVFALVTISAAIMGLKIDPNL